MQINKHKACLLVLTALTLSACGGGGGGDDDGGATPTHKVSLVEPANLSATSGSGQVELSWDAVPNADHYNLCYATQSITDFTSCSAYTGGTLELNVTSPNSVTGLTNGTQYYFRVVAVTAADDSGPASSEVSATPTLVSTGRLNDTGITKCGDYAYGLGSTNGQNNLDCAYVGATKTQDGVDHIQNEGDPVPAGQDAHYGRDATTNDPADGIAGFSFAKVCNSGEIAGEGSCPANPTLGSSANQWACTLDNVTGLIWEVKTDDGGLRDKNLVVRWYNSTGVNDGGNVGTPGYGLCTEVLCDTEVYVAAVSATDLCGAADWRLPTVQELQSIVNYGLDGSIPLTIDTAFFPNAMGKRYWTSTPAAYSQDEAWVVRFNLGFVDTDEKMNAYFVRLVRVGQ